LEFIYLVEVDIYFMSIFYFLDHSLE